MTTERPDDRGLEATQPVRLDESAAPVGAEGSVTPAVPAAATVVQPPDGSTGRRGGLRWGIALGAVAIAVGIAAAAAFLLTGQSQASRLAGWAPADAVVYGEVRMDLPGDQRARLGELLAHFPGFADQAILDDKIDEALDRIVSGATDGRRDFSTEIKPWFDGQIAFASGAPGVATGVPGDGTPGHGLALVAVKDSGAARTWFEGLAAEAGRALEVERHGNVDILRDADGMAAAAFVDRVMIAGDVESVRAAIDTKGASGLPESATFVAARASLPGDRLGFAVIDLAAVVEAVRSDPGLVVGTVPVDAAMLDLLPEWAAMGVRTDGSSLVLEGAWPHIEGVGFQATNRAGVLAARVPASTILLTDARDLGAVLAAALDQARSDPDAAGALAEIEQAASLLGGLDGLVGWIGDAGLAVTRDGSSVRGGIVIVPTDRTAADRLSTTLAGFLALFGAESGIDIRTETSEGGHEITIVDLGDAHELLGTTFRRDGLSGLPIDPIAPGSRVELAWAITDEVVVIALGPDFVREVLGVSESDSLAQDPRYASLLDAVADQNAGSAYVDLAAMREVVEGLLAASGGSALADYERDVKPYLTPFDAWVQATTVGEDLDRAILRISVE